MNSEKTMAPCAKWNPDCQGKWDYDGRLISISCRYWPAGYSVKPSATASICLNHGEPDEYGFCDDVDLATKEFTGETEAEVKAQVEAWVAEKFAVMHEAARKALAS